MKKKILAIGIVAMLVLGVGLAIAQEKLVKTEEYSNNELAKILNEHGMVQNPETGMFEVKTEGGIPEAGISGTELKEMIEESNLKNFRDPITGKINHTKLINFTDPVTKIVWKLKERGYSDSEITEILEKHGMGWYPETGATYIGIGPTEEELKHLAPLYNPTDSEIYPQQANLDTQQQNQVMEVENEVYRGIENMMCSGSCAIKEGETKQHVITTHVGKGGHWTEAGVIRTSWNTNWRLFTYDDDEEPKWGWHGTTSAYDDNHYMIYVSDTCDSNGYKYDIWIRGSWARDGHVPYKENNVDQANEIWSDTGSWTSDTIKATHRREILFEEDGTLVWWNIDVPTDWWHAPLFGCHVKEHHEMDGNAWRYETWVK